MKKEDAGEEFLDKEEEDIYDMITGKLRYRPDPFREEDLSPDLIIKIRVPNGKYIPRQKYLSLSNFMPSPSPRLERVYSKAEKQIAREMELNKENVDPLNLRMRLQLALNVVEVTPKERVLLNEHDEEELLELECVNSCNGVLDSFTIMYNTILYTLQQACGFRVKAFVLYGKKAEERDIYLFLTLGIPNLLRVANKYRIKKEVEYTHFDFFLNDPTTDDERPIKLHSKFISDRSNVVQLKHISRHFRIKETASQIVNIIEETDLDDAHLDNFRSCTEELHILYEYLKHTRPAELTNHEKMYLFEYNRRKLNPGVEKYFATLKRRREFFAITKEILPKYGYRVCEEPTVFEEFSLPDKHSRGATFFNRLESILLYRPMLTSPDGHLALFLSMERTKLAYMLLKQNFKISYLTLIGVDIFALENDFEKFGSRGGAGAIRGGLDGQCLLDNWNAYSLFSDFKTIRNYMGERVAFEILYDNYAIGYMASIIIPYVILFVLEQVFAQSVWLYTSQAEAFLYAISYSLYMFHWRSEEDEFIKNYCDAVESKIFLSKFRGPYMRNLLTDEANEFHQPDGAAAYLRNFACLLLIVLLLAILGSIFHGFRMMLLQIYEPLAAYQVGDALSLPHILAYALFFGVEEGFRVVVDRVIAFMVYLQNPPSDEDERRWEDTLTFFYLLAIEMIPPFYMLILEPFSGTSCYADSCESELTLYIYSRYIFIIGIVLVKFTYVLVFSYLRKNLQNLLKSGRRTGLFYQDKLAALLKRAIDDSKKPEHKEDKMNILTNLQNYAVYCTLLPISPGIVFLAVFIHFTSMRLSLLNEERRPLNRSESIIRFSSQLSYIYYLGIFLNTWINVFLLEFVEWNFPSMVERFSTEITEQGIFLLKVFTVIIYSLVLMIVGHIAAILARSFSENALNIRKDQKFIEYQHNRGGLKSTIKKGRELIPLKTVFRSFNPDRSYEEAISLLDDQKIGLDSSEAIGSAASLEKHI